MRRDARSRRQYRTHRLLQISILRQSGSSEVKCSLTSRSSADFQCWECFFANRTPLASKYPAVWRPLVHFWHPELREFGEIFPKIQPPLYFSLDKSKALPYYLS